MRDTLFVRDAIIKALKKEEEFHTMTVSEINGFISPAADIILHDEEGCDEAYRIVVVPYKREKDISQ